MASWRVQHVLEEVIIFSWLWPRLIALERAIMKDCPNWLLHYSLFILLSSLSPLGISQMSFMWDLPLGGERLLFLNDGRWWGCRAEELGQLTWPRGESLQVCGSHRNGALTPEGGRTWEYSAVWFRSLRYTWGIIGSSSRSPLSSL